MLVQRAKTPGEEGPKSYIWRGTLGLRHGKWHYQLLLHIHLKFKENLQKACLCGLFIILKKS